MQSPTAGRIVLVNLGTANGAPREVNGGREFPAIVVQNFGSGEPNPGDPMYVNCTILLPGAQTEAGWSVAHEDYAKANPLWSGPSWRWPPRE